MFIKVGDYQRKHLRAPFKEESLYVAGGFAHKAKAINISEGGMLLSHVPHFPDKGHLSSMLISFPQYPLFKNFSLEKLHAYSNELLPKKCARVTCEVVRKEGGQSEAEMIMNQRVGCRFVEINEKDKKIIKEYVDTFSGNLIFLQVLMDNAQADQEQLLKARALAGLLNYDSNMKLSMLRQEVARDYTSLQWL